MHRRAALGRRSRRRIVGPGIVPFALMLGVTIASGPTGSAAGIAGAGLVFGGSAQLTAVNQLTLGSGLLMALVAGAVVNARVLLYSAALQPLFERQPRWFQLLGAHFIQDQTYLSAMGRTGFDPAQFRRYWTWLGLLLLTVWTGAVCLGLAVAPYLPPLPHLSLVCTALFVAMLVPRLVSRPAWASGVAAAGTALAVAQVQPQIAIIAGAAAGVLAGMCAAGGASS